MMKSTPSTRASLLIRLRNPSDHEAWVEFVSLYEPAIYRLLRRTGLQDADAREVSQDLFLAVSRNIDRWQLEPGRGSFRGWLRRVTRNLMVSLVRYRRHRPTAVGGPDLDELFAQLPEADGPESSEFDNEICRARFRHASSIAKSEVSSRMWQAFWQTAIQGSSPADVAERLQMSLGAVRVAKCRVLARLKQVVAESASEATAPLHTERGQS